jgi:hypothetical protein
MANDQSTKTLVHLAYDTETKEKSGTLIDMKTRLPVSNPIVLSDVLHFEFVKGSFAAEVARHAPEGANAFMGNRTPDRNLTSEYHHAFIVYLKTDEQQPEGTASRPLESQQYGTAGHGLMDDG